MKAKFITIFLAMLGFLKLNAQCTQTIDLSTGVSNSGAMIATGSNEDSWVGTFPGGGNFTPIVVNGYAGAWANSGCSKWISPAIAAGDAASGQAAGNFTYTFNFNVPNTCPINSAILTINNIGADNTVNGFSVNGNFHGFPITNFSPLASPGAFTLGLAEVHTGANSVTVVVNNWNGPTGLTLCGNLVLNFNCNLTPSILGNNTFCSGSSLTFSGSVSPNASANYFWEIVESDQYGNPTSGGYSWSNWYSGTPSSFTFPNGNTLPCGKYYRIKLAVQSACVSWAETTKIIFIACPPTANAGPDVTICSGSCANLGYFTMTKFTNYSWANSSGYVGSGPQITVCPTTTTTYTLTAMNTLTACSSSDVVVVNVTNNDPSFSLSYSLLASNNYYTLFGTPNNTNITGITGFGYSWIVEEIVSPTNTTVVAGSQVVNSSCWWNSTMTNDFNGYDGLYFTSTGNNPMHLGCGTSGNGLIPGKFTAGHAYRITRGVWSSTCPWNQYSVITYMTHSMSGDNIHVIEDKTAPDYSNLMSSGIENKTDNTNSFTVYPNPSNGIFNIATGANGNGSLEVYDMLGKKIQTIEIKNTISNYELNLSGYTKGIYMINLIADGKLVSKKIILE